MFEVQSSEVKAFLAVTICVKKELSNGIKVVLQVEIPKYNHQLINLKTRLLSSNQR